MSEQPSRYTRSFGGMVGAMVVLLVAVGAYVAFRGLVRDNPPDPVQAVDYADAAGFARDEAPFEVVAPATLPEGWIATSVRFVDGVTPSWHLGMLTEDRDYVGLEQADRGIEEMVGDFVDEEATAGDPVEVEGEEWQSWTDAGGDLALVRHQGDTTTLVVGTVSEATLVDLIQRLG